MGLLNLKHRMMSVLPLLFGLLQAAHVLGDCGKTPIQPNVNAFIVGGSQARPHSLPWQISLQGSYYGYDTGHFCGGTIISDKYIITAAHCLTEDGMSYRVVVGAHSLRQADNYEASLPVEKVIIHEGYDDEEGTEDDIALLKLKGSIEYSDAVQPICLPAKTQEWDEDDMFLVSGWGAKKEGGGTPDKLHQVMVPYYNNDKCNSLRFYKGSIHDKVICAGYPKGRKDA